MILHTPRTLVWQLGLALMAMQTVAVFLLAWYSLGQFEQFNRKQTIAELHRLTPLLVHRYRDLLAGHSPAAEHELDRIVKEDARHTAGLRVTIIHADGRVIADSEAEPRSMENHRGRAEVEAAIDGRELAATRRSASTGVQTIYLAQPLTIDGRVGAVVRSALPLAVVSAEPAHVIRLVGGATLLSLVLTFLIIYFVSRQLGHAVARLAAGASRFAGGDLRYRIERPASNELATLADALNHMAEQLNEQIDLLRAQRNEQQAIHQSMSNGLIALDLDRRIISVNRSAQNLLGLDGDRARGRLLAELLREPELNRFVDQAIAGDAQSAEFALNARPGMTIQAFSEPLRNANDQLAGVLVFINDVTQLRRLESIRSDFAANVSHELRTPITNIKGYVETLTEVGFSDQQQARRFLDIISRNTQRLASIIEDLLALARLEQPGVKDSLERTTFALHRAAQSAAAQFESEIHAKRMTIVIDIHSDVQVFANSQLLEQALSNLLSNAIRYSPSGTAVRVSATPVDSKEVQIAVADQGPGIPAEHLPRIFERFYRVDKARSREIGGTGLGLSIVKHIALVHGGRVEADSVVGRGSTFRIVLPRS